MIKLKFKARVPRMRITVNVQRINFDCRTIECYLESPEEGDLSEFGFDEIELYWYAGIDVDRADVYIGVSL